MFPYLLALLLVFFSSLILFFRFITPGRSKNLPPGPLAWPILGNFPQLSDPVHVVLEKMSRTYGPVMSLWMGSVLTIVISTDEAVREALIAQGTKFASRPQPYSWGFFSDYRTSLSSVYGTHWIKLRRILNSHVLNPNNLIQYRPILQMEVEKLLSRLRKQARSSDGLVQPLKDIRFTTASIMTRVCFGEEFVEDSGLQNDKKVAQLEDCLKNILEMGSVVQLGDYIPLARFLPSSKASYKRYNEIKESTKELLLPVIAVRRKELDSNLRDSKCFMDVLLSLKDKEDRLTDTDVMWNLVELMVGGTDTVSSTLEWALALILTDDNIQQKAYEEIISVVGQDKLVMEEHLDRLPYLQAIVKETLRKNGPAVLSAPHATTEDCKLMGYNIPGNTQVLINQYAIMNDPKLWHDPEVFRPERYMNSESQEKQPACTPFGSGRRICPGMNMGKTHMYVILANLLLAFQWQRACSDKPVDLTGKLKFIYVMETPLQARIHGREHGEECKAC